MPTEICGHTQYFGDTPIQGRCQFKKCAHDCKEKTYEFIYNGQIYTRDVYCCNNKDYCNCKLNKIPDAINMIIISII